MTTTTIYEPGAIVPTSGLYGVVNRSGALSRRRGHVRCRPPIPAHAGPRRPRLRVAGQDDPQELLAQTACHGRRSEHIPADARAISYLITHPVAHAYGNSRNEVRPPSRESCRCERFLKPLPAETQQHRTGVRTNVRQAASPCQTPPSRNATRRARVGRALTTGRHAAVNESAPPKPPLGQGLRKRPRASASLPGWNGLGSLGWGA